MWRINLGFVRSDLIIFAVLSDLTFILSHLQRRHPHISESTTRALFPQTHLSCPNQKKYGRSSASLNDSSQVPAPLQIRRLQKPPHGFQEQSRYDTQRKFGIGGCPYMSRLHCWLRPCPGWLEGISSSYSLYSIHSQEKGMIIFSFGILT